MQIVREIPWSELECMVRGVPLKARDSQGNQVFPYQNARIQLREVCPEELCASSFYLIERNLEFQRRLRAELQAAGYDSLHLQGGLELVNGAGEVWRLIPPVVEVMHEEIVHLNPSGNIDYRQRPTVVAVHIVNDGMHRVALAREVRETVNVIHISSIPRDRPYYALPNGWNDVKVFTDTPQTMGEKKLYRVERPYDLYRDFGVLGCGAPRNTGQGEVKS
ncbi:hypothetical protein HY489_03065 [Candidatus Woesearchaeota archaeon]|nr:hypothetical protein [Candidatus Woesearchaeota archaeon]